ncbi:helicase-like protein [Orenia metallireducens]|uniref:Helicase conserved C-terminal domain-containing protein n=1 Tax=Orenia metallireducens TaxID=1413210 RepID=A0A285I212_9FIRM|nr:phospholipase D-like domain-containing anti-phage protein [Orenia metallireducens]PRX23243.1 helicase-like protein [Orenia metallireducens]SNY42040.1 Helicase conserved C-terminal domain-containing protein [Orenia metallireducens]
MIKRYSSRRESISDSLLNKRLENAKSYDRIAGYFSSSIFEVAGEALDSIEGKIRIVCNSDLQPEDVETAKNAQKAIRREWCESEPEKLENGHFRLKKLYDYLVSDRLEVRVLPNKEFGLIHGKAGVITLENGEKTSFLGSANESKSAWKLNYELVWEDNSAEAVKWVQEEFDALWNSPAAIKMPDFIIKDIKRLAEREVVADIEDIKDDEELPASVSVESPIYRQNFGLWEHQKYFINKAFKDHKKPYGARYVLADPVGLGKTIQLAMSAELMALYGDKPVLIIAPKTLMTQWQDELKKLLHLPTARWDGRNWIDENDMKYPSQGKEDIIKCPRRIGIISQGLITAKSDSVDYLLSKKYECIIVDEAHHARRKKIDKNGNFHSFQGNNLYEYLLEIAPRTKSMLLATATPIQLHPIELWDLLNVLSQGTDKVLGSQNSFWRKKGKIDEGLNLIKTNGEGLSPTEKWRWIKNPFPPSNEGLNIQMLRVSEDIDDEVVVFPKGYNELEIHNKGYADFLMGDFFSLYNPYIRHVVRRERKYLENETNPKTGEPYLDKIEVEVIDEAPLLLTGYMSEAYKYAEEFCEMISNRVKGGGFLKTLLLKRIGSSIEAGKNTGLKLKNDWGGNLDSVFEEEEENYSEIKDLTEEEYQVLCKYVYSLTSNKAEDPKYNKLLELLRSEKWIEEGVIIFSQYYDTAKWVANKLSKDFKGEKIGIYAGGNKSGYFLNDQFHRKTKDDIKEMVTNYNLKILIGTDSAAEGLNLQVLRRLINIDMPWNPTRLEQRKGRIQRGGQRFSKIYLYNMRYKDSVEDRVHELLSKRLKSITEIFGQLPDVLKDVWINIAIGKKEEAKKVIDYVPEKHPFEIRYKEQVVTSDWEICTKVLDEKSKLEKLKKSW